MDRMIYTMMSGAQASLQRQAVISHNLANVATTGFVAQLEAARAVPVQGDGDWRTRVAAVETTPGSDFRRGPVTTTGRDLDVALVGGAWLAVEDDTGAEAYVRGAALEVDAGGRLVTADGRAVVGEGGPLTIPLDAKISIGGDGTVSAIGAGEEPRALVTAGRIKLVTPPVAQLVRGEDGLFRVLDGAGNALPQQADDGARLRTGALEESNVSAVESMVSMIDGARLYEMHMRAIGMANDNAQQADRLLAV